jgi:LacI family transcriptional regulator
MRQLTSPLQSPERKSTLRDVAQRAGVSIKTVSRVANGEPHVRESTRSQVQSVIEELDYQPNAYAIYLTTLRSRRSNGAG